MWVLPQEEKYRAGERSSTPLDGEAFPPSEAVARIKEMGPRWQGMEC